MARLSGLILTPQLSAAQVTSLDFHFEPSMGIMARKVDKLGLDIRSFKEPLTRAVKQVMIPSIQQNFQSEGRPAWVPLSDLTVQKSDSTHPILDVTGNLRKGMSRLNIWHIDREKALITDLPDKIWYGKVHQGGARFKVRGGSEFNLQAPEHLAIMKLLGNKPRSQDTGATGEIPARPFVVLQKRDEAEIRRVFVLWLDERIARAGLR